VAGRPDDPAAGEGQIGGRGFVVVRRRAERIVEIDSRWNVNRWVRASTRLATR